MADTTQEQPLSEPHTNGVMDGLTEEEKSKMRPADIDADMREMERRKRVEMMMNSRLFREELERIIETQMKDGAGPSGLLQQISDMMGAQGARFNGNVFKNSNCVLPINDIRGVESMGYAKGEKLLRCKLAAVFRLLDLYGWTQGVGGQITARLNQDQEHFLVNPYGLLYHEITASSLIKVDMQGTIVEQGTTNFGVHMAGFQLHSTIHAARPDIKCIVHITTPSVTAISSLKCGLLPIGQESIVIGEVSTHQYIGGSFEPEEKEKISRNLGPMNKVMMLTNRGALCCGETVEEAFFNVYNMVLACETQLKLMPAGLDNLNLISEESKKAIFEASRKPPTPQHTAPTSESTALAEKLEKRWRIGGTEFEALMRMLDNAGFRTGYIYRNPLVKGELPRPRNDVEVPPAVSSLGYLLEEEELYKQGLWKGGRKGTDRSRWLNSPNVYQKVEILETGTPDPKKITKWVSDGSPTHSSTPVKIDGALQFVPKNTNPKEFKQIQQQIKDYRRADKISAGPQSHILEGVTWEEAKKMQDATISGTGEQVVLVGAASKGIIQRGFQHNAMVYKTPYAKNPFDAVTDQELDQYKKEVERKQKGDLYDESQSESEALSSFNVSRATHESSTAKSPIQSPVSVTSETEEESRDEPRVLRIETKQVPAPSQPEVVLSDDRDSSSRCCSHSESEYDNEIENEVCIYLRNYQIPELYQQEPRLEIARSDIIAERQVATLINYCPRSEVLSINGEDSRLVTTMCNGLEPIANSELQEESHVKRKTGACRSLDLKNDGDLLNFQCDKTTMLSSSPTFNEKTEETNRESKINSPFKSNVSFEHSIDQIAEMISCIDPNIPSTKIRVNGFSNSDQKISTKYSLNSTDMNVIYSLTPFTNSDDYENAGETILKESLPSFTSDCDNGLIQHGPLQSGGEKGFENEQQWNKKDCLNEKVDDFVWFDLLHDSESYDFPNEADAEIKNNTSFNNEHSEIRSNEGSDMLELPIDTVIELYETSGESFRNDISDSVNEIIAELNINDTYMAVFCIVNEIFQDVCDILFDIQVSKQCSSLLSSTCQFLTSPSHSIIKNEMHMLKENESYEANRSTPVQVIHEIIHHVIDVFDESQQKFSSNSAEMIECIFKNAKNSANAELKEAQDSDGINKEREAERQMNNLKPIINSNESNEKSCKKMQFSQTDVSLENLIETDEMNNQFAVKATEEDETTRPAAIFEFRTIVRERQTNVDGKAFELNFRVEKNNNVENVVEYESSHRDDTKKIEDSSTSSLNLSTRSENVNSVDQNIDSNNLPECDKQEMEFIRRSKVNYDDAKASMPLKMCVEYIHRTKISSMNHNEECSSLPPINEEETDEAIANLSSRQINNTNNNVDILENQFNVTYVCCDSDEKELSSHSLENDKNKFLPKTPTLNDQTSYLLDANIHPDKVVTLTSTKFA